jgi:hypothetical protein
MKTPPHNFEKNKKLCDRNHFHLLRVSKETYTEMKFKTHTRGATTTSKTKKKTTFCERVYVVYKEKKKKEREETRRRKLGHTRAKKRVRRGKSEGEEETLEADGRPAVCGMERVFYFYY